MIDQQLYLDGVLMDLAEDTSVVLDIKSNLFRDITQMSSNNTYSISIPKTVHNIAVLGNSVKPKSDSKYPYIFHSARYFRNGVEIIKNGRATVLSVSDSIEISIYFGLFPALTELQAKDLKLNELNCDKYVRFNRNNQIDTYENAKKNGVFYAIYDTARPKGISEDWQGVDTTEGENTSKVYALTDGRIFTGSAVGGNVLGEIVEDPAYRCAIVDFTAGMVAAIQDVVGKGSYRTWAVLDVNNNVVAIAEEVAGKTYTVGQAYQEPENPIVGGVQMPRYYINAGEIAANNYPVSMTVLSLEIGLGLNCPAGTIEYGALDIETGATERWGEVLVSAKQETATVAVNRFKEQGKVLYLRPSADKMIFCDTIPSTDTKIWSYVIGANGLHTSLADWKYKITYTSENQAIDVSLQAPATAAKLIVNTIKMYSNCTSFKVSSNTENKARGTISTQTNGGGSIGGNSGGSSGGGSFSANTKGPVQPSVTCNYVLSLISAQTNVRFKWSEKAQELIDMLAIPLITRYADANTLDGGVGGKINDATKLGILSLYLTKGAPSIFKEDAFGNISQLTVKAACTLLFDIQMYWSWDASKAKPNGVNSYEYRYRPCYIEMKVVSEHRDGQAEDEYTKTYIIGAENSVDGYVTDYEGKKVNGRFIHLVAGRGTLELSEGDIITLEAKRNGDGVLRDLKFYNGTITANVQSSDEVPYGGLFPIGKNLPDIGVKDFIKFLSLITNNYPMQQYSDGALHFADIKDISMNKSAAVDWTRKLIPLEGRNIPRQTDFSLDDFCQHNIYKWKEDDAVTEVHDADVEIDNNTLEYTRNVWTLPFAASDGSRVPIYDWEETKYYFGSKEYSSKSATKYKACKDRIMNLADNGAGNATLRFGIDLQSILNDGMQAYRKMIGQSRKITEYIRLSDIDIMNFDETKPVYLAQYGCYFAVLEIKTTDNGYCEVTMIEI